MRTVLCFVILFGSVASRAEYAPTVPSTDVPYLKASLTEIDSTGHEIDLRTTKLLTLYRDANSKQPTLFQFDEMIAPPPCVGEICPMMPVRMKARYFQIVHSTTDRCGSVHYQAFEKLLIPTRTSNSEIARPAPRSVLTVTDHSARTCKDWRRYHGWEVRLVDFAQQSPKVRNFFGDPEPVWDVELCLEEVHQIMCNMVYWPAMCAALSLDGGQTKIEPIRMQGSNPCHAELLIKEEGCRRGYDPDRFQGGDIICAVTQIQPPLCNGSQSQCAVTQEAGAAVQ